LTIGVQTVSFEVLVKSFIWVNGFSIFIRPSFYLSQHVFLTSVSLVKMFWFLSLCYDLFISLLNLCAFSALPLACSPFKLCLQISGLRMRNFLWNPFPIKNLPTDSLLSPLWKLCTWSRYYFTSLLIYHVILLNANGISSKAANKFHIHFLFNVTSKFVLVLPAFWFGVAESSIDLIKFESVRHDLVFLLQ